MEEVRPKTDDTADNEHGQTNFSEAEGEREKENAHGEAIRDVASGADLEEPLKGSEAHAERTRIRKLFRKQDVKNFLKANAVLIIAIIAAAVTCFFVPFDEEYAGYFDWRTLSCLFCTLAVVAAFKNIRFFVLISFHVLINCHTVVCIDLNKILGKKIIKRNTRVR